MKSRFFIVIIVLLGFLSLIFLARFIKRDSVTSKTQTEIKKQPINSINIDSYLREAEAFQEQGSLLEAKEIYQKLMDMSISSFQLSKVQQKLEDLNIKILFSGINIEESQSYEVKRGDVLVKIAKDFNTTVDAIVKANNIKANLIQPGMKLRILKGTFSILVDKSQNILILKFNNEIVKTYNVSTGKNNSTPIGTYKIVNKLIDPVWYKDGKEILASSPENILGSRWLGFDLPEYGIHGTIKPEDIGKQITDGCVRMRNEDVQEIYSLVTLGTEVTIID